MYSTLLTIISDIIFDMKKVCSAGCFLRQIACVRTLNVNIVPKTVINKQNACLVRNCFFCLEAVDSKANTRI